MGGRSCPNPVSARSAGSGDAERRVQVLPADVAEPDIDPEEAVFAAEPVDAVARGGVEPVDDVAHGL